MKKRLREERARDRQAVSDSIDQDEKNRQELQAKKIRLKQDFFHSDKLCEEEKGKELPVLSNAKTEPSVSYEGKSSEDDVRNHEHDKQIAIKQHGTTGGTVRKSNYNISLASRIALEYERQHSLPLPRGSCCGNLIDGDVSTDIVQGSTIIITTFTPKENRAPLREHYDDVEKQNEAEWKKKEYKEAAESGGGFNSCSKGMDINIYTT